jgi:uncharacterized repeat protein (TIGR01451 family)
MQGANGSEKKMCSGCLAGKGCLARKKEAEEIRGRCGQLLLTPTTIVAPVGGEVILLAGVCGKDEYLVTNEPIEWMLSPGGVGEFLEVGDDAKGQRRSSWKRDDSPKVEKLDVDFARGRTSREAGRITRGTSDKSDDLPIRKGQTWISLTSASEGVSKITALAPDSDVWDKRRQTATIYWVDASWTLPEPQFVRSGDQVQLIARVMKAEGIIPATGWTVKFRVTNPGFAKFMPPPGSVGVEPADVAEVPVNDKGVAMVSMINGLDPNAPNPQLPFGTAIIEMEVIRPMLSEKLPAVTVGRGTTSVTWSDSKLVLRADGPEIASQGQPLVYSASLGNVGDIPAENVVLTVAVPNGMRFESSEFPPDAQPTNNVLRWTVGPLPPRRAFDVRFTLVASTAPLDARVVFNAASASQQTPESVTRITAIQNPQIALKVSPYRNQTQIEVGNEAAFEIQVTNTGNQTVNDVTVAVKGDAGLQHVRDGRNELMQIINFLPPGQSQTLNAVFVVQREGDLCIDTSVISQNQALATQKSCIRGMPATPKVPSVKVEILGVNATSPVPVGTAFKVLWSVRNTGSVPLRDAAISMLHDPNFEVTALSDQSRYVQAQQLAQWRIPVIQPGSYIELSTDFRALNATPQASIVFSVATSENVSDKQTVTLQVGNGPAGNAPAGIGSPSLGTPGIGAPGIGAPGDGSVMPNAPGSGFGKPAILLDGDNDPSLKVSITPVSNAIHKGETGTYEVRIENLRSKPDQRVAIRIQCPEGSKLFSIRAKDLKYKLSDNDQRIDLEPIQYFRPNDVFSCVIQLRHEQAASGELLASVTSMGQAKPSVSRLSIQVLP